jgi:antitoxin MazE
MNTTVRSKVIKIGNSRGIRIPRTLLEQAGLKNDVEMMVKGNQLIINSAHAPRQEWRAQFEKITEQGDDKLLDDATPTQWDEEEWTW